MLCDSFILFCISSVVVTSANSNLVHPNVPHSTEPAYERSPQDRDQRSGFKKEWFPVAFCKTGLPLLRTKICNGKVDCLDGSDETAERCRSNSCISDHFRCNYGGCVSKTAVCNGVFNCADGSDERREVCKTVNCMIPYPVNKTVYFVSGCEDCRSGSRVKEGSILEYQCTNNNAFADKDSTDVICRNGVWIPSAPICIENEEFTSTTEGNSKSTPILDLNETSKTTSTTTTAPTTSTAQSPAEPGIN